MKTGPMRAKVLQLKTDCPWCEKTIRPAELKVDMDDVEYLQDNGSYESNCFCPECGKEFGISVRGEIEVLSEKFDEDMEG